MLRSSNTVNNGAPPCLAAIVWFPRSEALGYSLLCIRLDLCFVDPLSAAPHAVGAGAVGMHPNFHRAVRTVGGGEVGDDDVFRPLDAGGEVWPGGLQAGDLPLDAVNERAFGVRARRVRYTRFDHSSSFKGCGPAPGEFALRRGLLYSTPSFYPRILFLSSFCWCIIGI